MIVFKHGYVLKHDLNMSMDMIRFISMIYISMVYKSMVMNIHFHRNKCFSQVWYMLKFILNECMFY